MKKIKKTATMKRRAKKIGRGKPKGQPPKALQAVVKRTKKKRASRAVAPPPREVGLLDAIGEVVAVCEELGEEMRSWADNMPESKQGGDKHSEVEQCADTLEEQAQADPVTPESMSFLNEIKITIQDPKPSRRGHSRSTRLGDATDILTEVTEKLGEYIGDKTGPSIDIASQLKDELEEIESNLQGVEFPGMFG